MAIHYEIETFVKTIQANAGLVPKSTQDPPTDADFPEQSGLGIGVLVWCKSERLFYVKTEEVEGWERYPSDDNQ